jgi:hypothetical protein
MKKLGTFISVPVFIIFLSQVFSQRVNSHSTRQAELETILKKCAEYSERLSHSFLFFVCKEKITERISSRHTIAPKGFGGSRHTYTGTAKNVFVYDYQLYRKGKDVKERRTLIEENGKKKHEENAPLKTRAFEHENVVLGPIGLLSSYWQTFHDYRIIKEKKFKGDKTVMLEAVLKPEYTFHHLSGKIWVRKSDFCILKIEWFQHSIRGYEHVEETAKKLRAEPRLTLLAEYGTVVLYDDYKFFTVETRHAIKKGDTWNFLGVGNLGLGG